MAINKVSSTSSSVTLPVNEGVKKNDGAITSAKTDDAKFSAAAASLAASAAPESNGEKIASLRARIANGTYRPDASAIAGKLLQEAWQIGSH